MVCFFLNEMRMTKGCLDRLSRLDGTFRVLNLTERSFCLVLSSPIFILLNGIDASGEYRCELDASSCVNISKGIPAAALVAVRLA